MTRMHRAGMAVMIGALAAGAAATAQAQIPGMPLFTNPRYASGIRLLADIGQPTDKGTAQGDWTVVQGGAAFALGPVGIGVSVGENLRQAQSQFNGGVKPTDNWTGSALAQIRILGAGVHPGSLSLFGGASMDLNASQLAGTSNPKVLTIPVGVAIGYNIPLGLAHLNVWGAPRFNITKLVNCQAGTPCSSTDTKFRWAVGADLPIFRIISIRAAYDSGKYKTSTGDVTLAYWGVGASIGIGGMR
jgi:hypothetical protein